MVVFEIAAILGACLLYRRHKDKKQAKARAAAGYANQYQHYTNNSYPPHPHQHTVYPPTNNYPQNSNYPPAITKGGNEQHYGHGYGNGQYGSVHGSNTGGGAYRDGTVYAHAAPYQGGNPPAYRDEDYHYPPERRDVKGGMRY